MSLDLYLKIYEKIQSFYPRGTDTMITLRMITLRRAGAGGTIKKTKNKTKNKKNYKSIIKVSYKGPAF